MELEDEIIAVWIERLANVQFHQAVDNLNRHIDNEEFFPKISQIINGNPRFGTAHEHLKLETAERFTMLEEGWSRAVAPPAHIEERWGRK